MNNYCKEIQALLDYKKVKISIGKLKEILGMDMYEARDLIKRLGIEQDKIND